MLGYRRINICKLKEIMNSLQFTLKISIFHQKYSSPNWTTDHYFIFLFITLRIEPNLHTISYLLVFVLVKFMPANIFQRQRCEIMKLYEELLDTLYGSYRQKTQRSKTRTNIHAANGIRSSDLACIQTF
jgi:hypothetical protein